MRTQVPEKLQAIVEEIDAHGSASLTRLTVLKKWFEHLGRLPAFGLWTAKRAAGRKGKSKAAAGALMDEARALLGTTATREGFLRIVEPGAAKLLHDRARDFQNKFQHQQWGPVRIFIAGRSFWWSRAWRSISARWPHRLRVTSWPPTSASTMTRSMGTA